MDLKDYIYEAISSKGNSSERMTDPGDELKKISFREMCKILRKNRKMKEFNEEETENLIRLGNECKWKEMKDKYARGGQLGFIVKQEGMGNYIFIVTEDYLIELYYDKYKDILDECWRYGYDGSRIGTDDDRSELDKIAAYVFDII